MAGFLSVVYGSLFLFLLSVLKLWLLSRWLLPRLISFVVRRSNEKGVDITVGAVGFFHISDLRVEFLDGPIERVVVGDLLYTGRLLTLLAWLFEFVGKRARGVRLRDHIDDETANGGGAEGADTAVRDGDSSPKHSTSAGAFIARSRSLARQSSTVSSNNATSTSVTSPLRASLGSPTAPHASRTSEAGTGGTSGVDGASGDPFDEDEPVRDPRRSRSSGGGMMNLNVPVLVAGLRVTLRPVSSGATKPNKVEGDTGKETGGGEDDGDNTKKKGAGHLAWSTWQLLKNAATFIKVTVTDVSIDARNMDNASLRGVHTARRAVLAATTAFKGRGLTLTALTERIAVGAEDVSDVTHSCSRTAVRGYLLDGRVDISARYSARERRAVCVGVELDVGDLDVETNAGGGGGVSQTFTSSLARDSDEEGAGATFSSNFATVASRLESLPATVSCRLGRVRVRRSARADSIGDGSIDRPLVGVAADLSVRCVRQTKEERVARHRRKNRSLFPDKETIAKLTARSTVEARWRSLDIHTTEHENGIDDTFGDITQSEKEPEARSRCGESVFTARFPLVKSNGPKTVVPKATVRAEVRRADGCNHPALVRAVASAVRSTGGFQKKPSRKVGLDGKKERASKPCEWTCDARLHFVDGVRLRAHDGDRGVVGEWHARRWELSEDDLALFGESRRVGIEGGEESGSPGSKLSLSPSISSSVEGLRVALSPVDTVADPRARHTRALRPVLSAERFGWSKGPVSPPPPSPGSWAERDDDSKGGDGNTGSSRSATAGSYARDVELMGATIELTCGDAVALDRSWRRTMESLARSFSEVKRVQSGGGGGVKNDDEDDDGGGSSESNGPKTPVSTAVTLIDVCARIHADMPTRGHPDVDVTYAPSIPTNSKCALELTVPLSTVSSTDGGTRGGSGWRLETSGWYVTYHDGVCTDADPSADINGVHPAQFADGSETAPGGFNSSSKGRPEMRAENGTVRVLTVEHGAIDHSLDTDTTTMSGDGVWGFWQPDAHFMAQEAAAAMNAVSSARKDSEAFNAAGLSEAKDKKSLERRGGVGLDLSRVTFAFDVTAGGAVTLSAHGLTSTDIAAAIRASKPSIAVNGYPVCSSESAEVTFGGGNENDGGKVLPALGETSTSVCDSSNRKRVRLTVGPDTRLVLPWGLDLGDAEAALDAGYAAFISVGGSPFANSSSSSKSTRASQREVPLEFTLEACGTLRADAFDSPLARCVRGKSAVLGPALASARAAEAAKTQGSKSSEKQSAYEARVAAYVEACVAAAAEGAVSYPNGSSADVLDSPETPKNPRAVYHESAARVTIEGGFKSTFVVGGYRSSNNDLDAARSLDELNAVQASPSERAAKRADAPWSDNVRLRVSQAARIRIDARDVSVDLPLSPAPVFRCGRFLAEGFVATARQATVGIPGCPPPLPLPVGRRRFGSSRHPASPPRPPVKLYTDVDVTLEHPGGCFAVASEPALMSLSQQLVRMSPPSSGHANAPGGRGGRLRRDAERAAASWDAAHRGWPKGPDGCYGAAAPSLPPWDFWRASWRGRARVTGSELAYVIDARCAPTIAEVRAGPVGLEFGASRIEVDVSPGSINIRAARLTLGARGGVGTPGHDPDDEQPSAANNFGDVDVSLEEKAGMSVCLAVVPAVELTLGFDWATLGNVGGGGQDHHGFDSLTGIERVPYAGQFSVGCHLTAHATLTTKERALPRWRAETDDSTWQGGVDEGAETSKNAAKPPDDSAPTPFVKRDTNRRASLGTPGSMGTPGSLTKWTSGDFFARISGGGGDVSSPNGDVASPNGPPTPSSPSSPAFASRVSAAAAASVADEANTPTIIVGPRALRWLRRFVKDLSSPSGCARRAWRLPTPGGPKRVRHPLSKSINYVIDEVSFSASCDNLRVAHPAESESDPARGLTAQVTGLRVTSRLKPAPPSAQSPYEKTGGVGLDGLRRKPTIEPSCVLDTLEVELEEVRVLLPPADNAGEVFSPNGAKKGSTLGSNNGSNVDSPSGGVSGLRGFGTGDFDQEAEGYKAVIEMLEGRSVGASFQGPGSPGDGSGLTSGVTTGVSESRFARESQFARRRRETATDPALVLETRSVKLVRRVDSPPAFTVELTPVNSKTPPPGGVNGGVNPWLHVTVEAPRLLKAASTRDALVQWIRDAYRAALKPNPPKRSLTSLNALASRPDETVDPETGFKLTDGFGDETSQTGSTLNEGSSRATNAERLGLPNHIRGKSSSSSGSHGQRAKSSSTSSHMGVGLFDDDFDLIDDSVFGDGQTDAKDETAVTKNATNPTTTPAGTKRREKHQSWDGSPVSTAAAKGDHPNEADLLSLLLHEPKDQAAVGETTCMGKQSPEPESAGSAAHRRSRSELPASLTLPSDVQEARALTSASVATIPEGRPALKPVAVADAGEEREEEEIMFVVDVTTPQINFEGKDGADDDTIFANRGIISPTSPTDADDSDAHWGRRVVAVRLLDAQAHVAPLDVDVYAGVQWLDESLFAPDVETRAGKQSQTSGKSTGKKQEAAHSYLLRQVFKPCRMDLDFTTHIPEKKKIARVGGDLTPSNNTNNNGDNQQPTTRVQDSGNDDGGKTASKSKRKRPEALTEFALRSPEIEAEMSSDQFAALVDVIGSIFLAQIPDHPPRPAMKATALLAVEGRSLVEGEERASAAVVAGPLAAFRVARWAATCAVVDASLAEIFAETQEKCVGPGLGLRSKSGGSKSVPFDGEACARVSRRLARRVEDAERAVDEAVASAEALVRPTRRRPAIKLSLSVDRFRWALRVSGRTFLVARIERLALSRERHVDSSGVTNLRCHELNLDVPPPKVQGARSAQAWADQKGSWKPVLARWDPNAPAAGNTKSANTNSKPQSDNANNRPLVRVSALRAASPPEAPIWDRIEVDVQPFDLRIERDMYDRLIAYIFPEKNGDVGAVGGASGKFLEGHDAYARSLTDTREEWRRKHGTSSASAGIERGTPSKAPRGFSATTIDPKPESEARKILLGTMSPQRFPPKSATNAQSHKRSATWGADLFQAKGGNGGGGYQELADSDVTDEGQQGHKGGQKDGDDMSSLNRRRSRPPSLALPSDTDPDLGLNTGATNQPPAPEEHKKVAVRHLKVNEVLLRVSYDGKPRSFHEVRLLLDEVVTANFEGRWRELIGQLKGNVVWSVLKSITGLQGRRLPGGSTQVTAAADKPTHVVVDSPTKKSGTRTDKGTRAPYKHISESEDEDAFGDDDDDDGVTAGRDGGDGVNAGAYGSQSAGPKRKTRSLFKRVFGVAAFKTAATSDKTGKSSADEREKLARLMGGKR